MKLADVVLLQEQLLDLRGDPRLSAWEEGFVSSLSRLVETHRTAFGLSAKQHATLREIQAKVGRPAREELELEEPLEDDGDC